MNPETIVVVVTVIAGVLAGAFLLMITGAMALMFTGRAWKRRVP